ncbi:MAG: SDR family NAD(P)-dependent oxidoreductase, partial [Planctomycetes bacterium]|nr:SDR family NAD(P)-dependent oxidoreductase [Planctomycetota bacterium]
DLRRDRLRLGLRSPGGRTAPQCQGGVVAGHDLPRGRGGHRRLDPDAPADLGGLEDIERTVATVTEQLGQVDILVNGARATRMGGFSDFTDDEWLEEQMVKPVVPLQPVS